jgi:hypothetical protein
MTISLAKQITNENLKRRVEALGTGLVRNAGLVPEKSSVLLLLNDSLGASINVMGLRLLLRLNYEQNF